MTDDIPTPVWNGKHLSRRLAQNWTQDGFSVPDFSCQQFWQWINTDQADRYRPDGNRYSPKSFGYTLNSRGFRCDDFGSLPKEPRRSDDPPRILFIGCSHTFGVGLPDHEIWPRNVITALARDSGPLPYWNIAFGGRSQQWVSRMLSIAVPLLRPDVVVALMPPPVRFEVWHDGMDRPFAPNFTFSNPIPKDKIDAIVTFFTPEQMLTEMLRNMSLVHSTCAAYGAELIWDTWERVYFGGKASLSAFPAGLAECWRDFSHNFEISPYNARDHLHPGWETHAHIAATVLPHLRKLLRP